MINRAFSHLALGLLSLALTFALARPSWADAIPAEKRLPPGVLAFVKVPSVPDLAARLKDSATGGLINDPAFDEFRAPLQEALEELAGQAEEELGFPLSDLEALLAGEAAFAVVRNVGQPLGMVAFLEVGDHHDILNQVLAKIDTQMMRQDSEKGTDSFANTEITVYSPMSKPGARANPFVFAYAVKDDLFVAGSSVAAVEAVLTRWDGTHAMTFADAPIYNRIIDKCSEADSAPVVKWYLDPVQLTLAGLSMSPDTQLFSAMAAGYLPLLGLNQLKGIGGTMEVATEQFDSVSRTMFYAEPPTTGILKIFEMPSTIVAPPAWVPEDAGIYFGFHWNVQGAYEAIGTLYDTVLNQPGGFERMVTNAAKQASGPDLHPKDDVIDVVTGVVHAYFKPPAGRPQDFSGMFAFGVSDEAKARKLLDALSTDGARVSETFQGTEIFKNGNGKGAAAITGGFVHIASDEQFLKDALAGNIQSLSQSASYRRVASHVPEKVSLLTVSNANQFKSTYESLRTGQLNSLVEGKVDFTLLPPFEEIAHHFASSTSYTVADEQGALMVQFTLRPE